MLVTDELNVTYLSGFSGDSSYLLVLPKNTIIISDFRYIQEIEHDCPDIDSVIRPSVQTMVEASKKLITKARVASVALKEIHFRWGRPKLFLKHCLLSIW